MAVNGVYQHSMSRDTSCSLVRLSLAPGLGIYPEISGGQHRFTIRLMQWEPGEERPTQINKDVSFDLAIC